MAVTAGSVLTGAAPPLTQTWRLWGRGHGSGPGGPVATTVNNYVVAAGVCP